jgi:hypothetical protein
MGSGYLGRRRADWRVLVSLVADSATVMLRALLDAHSPYFPLLPLSVHFLLALWAAFCKTGGIECGGVSNLPRLTRISRTENWSPFSCSRQDGSFGSGLFERDTDGGEDSGLFGQDRERTPVPRHALFGRRFSWSCCTSTTNSPLMERKL